MNRLIGVGVFSASLLVASTASAIPIATVGAIDTFLHQDHLDNSGDATEKQFIADYLNVNPSTFAYAQVPGSGGETPTSWQQVTGGAPGTNLWAFDFGASSSPAYFIVKTGNLHATGDPRHFLYQNLASQRYAVIDLNNFGDDLSIELGKISHLGATGTTTTTETTPTPEPATLLLLGAGLAYAARQMRRRNRS